MVGGAASLEIVVRRLSHLPAPTSPIGEVTSIHFPLIFTTSLPGSLPFLSGGPVHPDSNIFTSK